MTDEVKALLAQVEERRRRYSRRVALFDLLYLPLLVVSMAFLFLGAVVNTLYGYDHRPLVVVSATLWVAGYLSYILYTIYDGRAAETTRQACELRCMLLKPETGSAERI